MGTRFTTFFALTGGGKRDRTADLLHAMQALSQLSYTPFVAPLKGAPRRCREMDYRQVFMRFSSALKLFASHTRPVQRLEKGSVLCP